MGHRRGDLLLAGQEVTDRVPVQIRVGEQQRVGGSPIGRRGGEGEGAQDALTVLMHRPSKARSVQEIIPVEGIGVGAGMNIQLQ